MSSLQTAYRAGELDTIMIARRLLTTKLDLLARTVSQHNGELRPKGVRPTIARNQKGIRSRGR